jgi:hypothetical protein
MNTYELKQQARKERYEELALKNTAKSTAAYETARKIADMIPFGQPILVGHHSERRHRNAIDKIGANMRKSIELDKTAEYYANKAENISNAISSDDPDAVTKLQTKLAELEKLQEEMKKINKSQRLIGNPAQFPGYRLTNNNANIRNIKLRISQLQKAAELTANDDVLGSGWTLHEDKEQNRIQFLFTSIPSEETRSELRYKRRTRSRSQKRVLPRNHYWCNISVYPHLH